MSQARPSLLWFRQDLRLADNPALLAAVRHGGPVVPVFIWSPEEERPWQPGAASRWWLHQSLVQLEAALGMLGSRLMIRRGPTRDALRELIDQTGRDRSLLEPPVRADDQGPRSPGEGFLAATGVGRGGLP